jgi:branched-chain amino acid transport system substrate-binding protein
MWMKHPKLSAGFLLTLLLSVTTLNAVAESPIKIGVIAPLSGAFAPFGSQIQSGILFAADPHTKLIFEDSKFDTKTALAAFRKLTTIDHVDYLISAGGETCTILNQEAQKLHLIHIAVGCNTAKFENPDSYNFRLDVNEAAAAQQTAAYLSRKQVRTIGIINIENAWGSTVVNFASDAFAGIGIKVSAQVSFQPERAGDLRGELARVKAAAPDELFIVSSAETFALNLKQLKQLQIATPIMSTISVENPKFIELTSKDSEGIVYLSTKQSQSSIEKFPEFFQKFPAGSTFAAWGFDAVNLIRGASEAKDPKSYLQNLRGFVGAFNIYNYDKAGELNLEYEIRVIKDGHFRYLDHV